MDIHYDKTYEPVKDIKLGYLYFLDRQHPLANTQGKVYEHRHIASIKIGRWISTSEHVHHINGIKDDNRPENLVVVLASEHAHLHKGYIQRITCAMCNVEFKPANNSVRFCSIRCLGKHNRKFDIEKDELSSLVWEYPTTHIASIFGVSDKAIEKRCKKFGISKPKRGYWAKRMPR